MAEDKAKRAARQKEYNARPENIKKRAANNKARSLMIKKYGKSALKGKDVDHKTANNPSSSSNNSTSNLRIMSVKKNRGRNNN